jgi:hypothetical protein
MGEEGGDCAAEGVADEVYVWCWMGEEEVGEKYLRRGEEGLSLGREADSR